MAKKPVKNQTQQKQPGVEVNHGNASLLTVKFLDLILQELKKLNEAIKNG